jgi:hypothetical protein
MRKVAVVVPEASGGVKAVGDKLVDGLSREGFNVIRINIYGKKRISRVFQDLSNVKSLRFFDAVIYMGSIPYPSSWFIKSSTKVLVFLHGFIVHEIISELCDPHIPLGIKIKSLYLLQSWNFNKLLGHADLYVCHSLTTCEMNGIYNRFILLPQFIFPEEVDQYIEYRKNMGIINKTTKILAYVPSRGRSPRLLSQTDLLKLVYCVSKRIGNRIVELLIIDPNAEKPTHSYWNNLIVHTVPYLPRREFIKLMLKSDLYIDTSIDEELKVSSIEAALLGVPIAKLTHPKFVDRQDYKDEFIWASTPKSFIDVLVDYIINKDHLKPYYAKKVLEFLILRRNWNIVSQPLLDFLRKY